MELNKPIRLIFIILITLGNGYLTYLCYIDNSLYSGAPFCITFILTIIGIWGFFKILTE